VVSVHYPKYALFLLIEVLNSLLRSYGDCEHQRSTIAKALVTLSETLSEACALQPSRIDDGGRRRRLCMTPSKNESMYAASPPLVPNLIKFTCFQRIKDNDIDPISDRGRAAAYRPWSSTTSHSSSSSPPSTMRDPSRGRPLSAGAGAGPPATTACGCGSSCAQCRPCRAQRRCRRRGAWPCSSACASRPTGPAGASRRPVWPVTGVYPLSAPARSTFGAEWSAARALPLP
jgi:hypothetical protein